MVQSQVPEEAARETEDLAVENEALERRRVELEQKYQ